MYKNNYKIIHKPKNAKIFSNFNSYNFQPSEPIKISNNITYKLSNSVDKNSNNFMSTDNKIFNNLNTYATISKAMNMKNDNKVKNYYHNRPLSAQKNNIKNGINNNLYLIIVMDLNQIINLNYFIPSKGHHHLLPQNQ
jgi:hypothetical protein